MNQKSEDNGESDDSSAESDVDQMAQPSGKIKCVGIQEEDIFADQAFKNQKKLSTEEKK